jgi:hypothetical protein
MKSLAAIAAVVLAGCAAPPPRGNAPAQVQELAGRVAGAPQRCIPFNRTDPLRMADGRTLLYGYGRTIWVNRLGPRCSGFPRDAILIAEPLGAQYCRGDRIRSVDPVSHLPGPACIIGDFVPYTR